MDNHLSTAVEKNNSHTAIMDMQSAAKYVVEPARARGLVPLNTPLRFAQGRVPGTTRAALPINQRRWPGSGPMTPRLLVGCPWGDLCGLLALCCCDQERGSGPITPRLLVGCSWDDLYG